MFGHVLDRGVIVHGLDWRSVLSESDCVCASASRSVFT